MQKYLIILILIFLSLKAVPQRQHLVFESTFEGPNYIAQWNNIESCFPTSITPSTTIVRYGNQSVKFVSNIADTLNCNLVRSQLILFDTTAINYERWYGMSVYFGNGFPINYDGIETFFQMFGVGTELYPPFARPPFYLAYDGYHDGVNAIWPSGKYFTSNRMINSPDSVIAQSPQTHYIQPVQTVQFNTWVDIVMNIKWSNDTTGKIRIWVNNTLRYSYNGVTNHTSNYVRIGIDKWDWRLKWGLSTTTTRELYYDEFRIGNSLATYSDVYPGQFVIVPIIYTKELTAKKIGTKVQLDWEAYATNNFKRFEIQRAEQSNFVKIGEVTQSQFGQSYQFIDNSPKPINYYRLKEISIDEPDRFSRIVLVKFSTSPTNVTVYDVLGRMIRRMKIFNPNNIMQELNLIAGTYIIMYENGQTERVVVLY